MEGTGARVLQRAVAHHLRNLVPSKAQAAVQGILDAGHIPAGMELFKAGNESQLKTIYNWIDESDVYMLILGGRYGTIEEKSGLSYTELEYRYALSKNIPVFAVILSESFLEDKIKRLGLSNVIEQKEPDKYKVFKSLVMSKTVRMVNDCKDIRINIYPTLKEFLENYDLIGWTKGSEMQPPTITNDTLKELEERKKTILNLNSENVKLNQEISQLKNTIQNLSKKTEDLDILNTQFPTPHRSIKGIINDCLHKR